MANVDASNRDGQPVEASAAASASGSFTTTIPAQLGDRLEITATDAAGNTSASSATTAGPTPMAFAGDEVGDVQLFTFASGAGAVDLPFPTGAEGYMVVVQALNPSGGSFPVQVSGSRTVRVEGSREAPPAATPAGPETRIRRLEREIFRALGPPAPIPSSGRRLAPAQDEVFSFPVGEILVVDDLFDPDNFVAVPADLRYTGDHVLIYVDRTFPLPELTQPMIDAIGERFDDQIYPTNRNAFGAESDVDGDGLITILLTPLVNAMTVDDSEGVTRGFFFGNDLFPQFASPFSNEREMFYMVVPDADNMFGAGVFPPDLYVDDVSGTAAHEFQHMISANQHVLVRNGQAEALWLDEGLSHYAETLNGFDFDNRLFAAVYTNLPQSNGLVGNEDTLERRGAAMVFVSYLVDRFGPSILGRLVQTSLTSVPNVEAAANRSLSFLFHEFAAALFLDGTGLTNDPIFELSRDLRGDFEFARPLLVMPTLGTYLDIRTRTLSAQGSTTSRTVAGTAAAYFDVGAAEAGAFPIVAAAQRSAELQVTVIRVQ